MSARGWLIFGAVGLAVAGLALALPSGDPVNVAPPYQAVGARVYGRLTRIPLAQADQCRARGGQVMRQGEVALCLSIVTEGGVWAREIRPRPKIRM